MEKFSCSDLEKYLESDLIPLIEEDVIFILKLKLDGSQLVELSRNPLKAKELGMNDKTIKRIKDLVDNYLPCDPAYVSIAGIHEQISLDSKFTLTVQTKDKHNKLRYAFPQTIELNFDEDEFQLDEYVDKKNGRIEFEFQPLKIGRFNIGIQLSGNPIKGSPFTVVIVPNPPPITNILKLDLNPKRWIEIAHGQYGRIYKGQHCSTTEVAIKEMKGVHPNNADQKQAEFIAEVNILQRLAHPNIIMFLGVCLDGDQLEEWFIVLELAEHGSLEKVLKGPTFPLERKSQFCSDISKGMSWLHARTPPIIHFDLKPANILVCKDYVCKIADFGLSLVSKMKDSTPNRGTMLYMPPETLRKKWYTKVGRESECRTIPMIPPNELPLVDVYAFGLIMWEIFTQKEVFSHYSEIDPFCRAVCDNKERPDVRDPLVPNPYRDIISNCWSEDSKKRPTFKNLNGLLEIARLQSILVYPDEVSFWKTNWPNKVQVPLNDFVKRLFRTSGLIAPPIDNNLRFLLSVSEKENVVTLGGYRKFLEWFGPVNEGTNRLSQVSGLLQEQYFRATINNVEAERLIDNKQGNFVLRLNTGERYPTNNAPFTLTYYAENTNRHIRIYRVGQNYEVDIKQPNSKQLLKFSNSNILDLMVIVMKSVPTHFSTPAPSVTVIYGNK